MPPVARGIPNRSVLGRNIPADLRGDELLKKLTAYIKKQIRLNNDEFVGINKGDTVILESDAGYRNEGVYMWNGTKVIALYTEVDDYGSVPPEIEIAQDNDFTPDSWVNLIDHNAIIWFSPELRNMMDFERQGNIYVAYLNFDGVRWKIEYTPNNQVPENFRNDIPRYIQILLAQNRGVFELQTYGGHDIHLGFSNMVHGRVRSSSRSTGRSRAARAAARAAPAAPPAAPAAHNEIAQLYNAAAARVAARVADRAAAPPAAPVPPPAPPVAPLSEREQNIIRVLEEELEGAEAELEGARVRVARLQEALRSARISGGRRKNKINK